MSNDYDLIVFDWDGTLMDSAEHITYCIRHALHSLGEPERPDHELRQVIGLGLIEAMAELIPGRDDIFYSDLADSYRQHWLNSPPGLTRFFDGIPGLLENLYSVNIPMAVATGKSRRGLDKQLNEEKVSHLFKTSRCADETASKPAPDMLLEILRELSVPASKALVVGDTEFDMQMAESAGCDRIAVSYGVHDTVKLARYAPVALLESPAELIGWFDSNIIGKNKH